MVKAIKNSRLQQVAVRDRNRPCVGATPWPTWFIRNCHMLDPTQENKPSPISPPWTPWCLWTKWTSRLRRSCINCNEKKNSSDRPAYLHLTPTLITFTIWAKALVRVRTCADQPYKTQVRQPSAVTTNCLLRKLSRHRYGASACFKRRLSRPVFRLAYHDQTHKRWTKSVTRSRQTKMNSNWEETTWLREALKTPRTCKPLSKSKKIAMELS